MVKESELINHLLHQKYHLITNHHIKVLSQQQPLAITTQYSIPPPQPRVITLRMGLRICVVVVGS